MKFTIRTTLLTATFLGTAFAGRSAYASETPYIGVQFYSDQDTIYTPGDGATQPLPPTGSPAGVVPQEHFNTVLLPSQAPNPQSGSGISLVNAGGGGTAVTLTYSAPSSWFDNSGAAAPDNELMQVEVKTDGGGTSTATFTLNNVPTGFYNLDVYILNDNANDVASNYTVGSTTYYVNEQDASTYNNSPSFVLADNTDPLGTRDTGNYVEFDNISPVDGTITLTEQGISGGNGNSSAAVNAFQLVSVPEPATFSLIGAGALGLLARRRHR